MMGVLIHVLGDCANNIGVVIAAAVIWFASYGGRFYADPAVSMGIAIMIFISSIPLSMYTFPNSYTYAFYRTYLTLKKLNNPVSSSFKVHHKASIMTT